MSISLTIDDPAKTPRAHLIAALVLIETLSPGVLAAAGAPVADKYDGMPLHIAPEDLPDVGRATAPLNPAAAFGTHGSAFGHGSAELDADAVKLEALAGPGAAGPTLADIDPAAAFGDAGNGQAATLPPPPAAAGNPVISIPPTASLPPAPPSAPNVAAAPAGAVELDKDGLPWNATIHAKGEKGARPMNADGRWRKKRGVEDATVAAVEAELRALMAIPSPAPVAAPAAQVGNVPPAPPITAPTAPATIPTAPAGAISFVQLVQKTGQLNAAGKLTQDEIVTACQSVGAANLSLIAARPDLVAQVAATIDAIVASKA